MPKTSDGKSPAMFALENDNYKLTKFLIKSHENTHTHKKRKNNNGNSKRKAKRVKKHDMRNLSPKISKGPLKNSKSPKGVPNESQGVPKEFPEESKEFPGTGNAKEEKLQAPNESK